VTSSSLSPRGSTGTGEDEDDDGDEDDYEDGAQDGAEGMRN
jgi:hypothetical protein